MGRIRGERDIAAGLDALLATDARLAPVLEAAQTVPLRLAPRGYAGLASIIIAQQVSKASADAIFGRFEKLVRPLEAGAVLAAGDGIFREAGISRPKQRTLIAIAEAVEAGAIDLDAVCAMDAAAAVATMTGIKGIGPWTAEIYLMFCAGHADIFPAGDLALQEAARVALALRDRPRDRELREMAQVWSPWRSVAARLLWSYYRCLRDGRDAMPL